MLIFLVLSLGLFILWRAWHIKSAAGDDEGLCGSCGYDLRASVARCPECGTPFRLADDHIPLRDDWPADAITPRLPTPQETPVVIHQTDNQWEARTLRDQFDVRGIWAQVQAPSRQPASDPYLGSWPRIRGNWRVAVWSSDVELARAIRDKLLPSPAPRE